MSARFISSAMRFMFSVLAASSPFLSVITDPPIFSMIGFAALIFCVLLTLNIKGLIEKPYQRGMTSLLLWSKR
jgi:hypothetical protein